MYALLYDEIIDLEILPLKGDRMMISRITSDPNICGGEPCIASTRIPVHIILSHLAAGDSIETLLEEFPHIERVDIESCLEYAAFLCTEKAIAR
jgi:uncharacterized protein (DUF433 family)